MELPHVTMPWLLIKPKDEEARFWAEHYPQLHTLDIMCVVSALTGLNMLWTYLSRCKRDVPQLCAPLFIPVCILLAAAVLQGAVMYRAPTWWRQHRGHAAVAQRVLYPLVFMPLLAGIRTSLIPRRAALTFTCKVQTDGVCGGAQDLTLFNTVRFFVGNSMVRMTMQLPLSFSLPFARSAPMQAAAGALYAWLSVLRTDELQAVDARLLPHARDLCVWLGAPARDMSEVMTAWRLPLAEQCARAPVVVVQPLLALLLGVALPLVVSWLVELRAKNKFVVRRQQELLLRQRVPAAMDAELEWHWRLVGVAVWVVRAASLLAVLYTGLWQAASLALS